MEKTYDTIFMDVDGTLLWVDLDVEGYEGNFEATFTLPDLKQLTHTLGG